MKQRCAQGGFSLLEVLLAWSLLAGVLLSVLAVSLEALRLERHEYFALLAVSELGGLRERLQGVHTAEGVARERVFWQTEISSLLPSGVGVVECVPMLSAQSCEAQVAWEEGSQVVMHANFLLPI